MIPLTALSDPSDVIAFIALAVLAAAFGLLPAHQVMPLWIRKRQEVALIWAVAGLHRGAEFFHMPILAPAIHLASAVVAMLAAGSTVISLVRGLRHGP